MEGINQDDYKSVLPEPTNKQDQYMYNICVKLDVIIGMLSTVGKINTRPVREAKDLFKPDDVEYEAKQEVLEGQVHIDEVIEDAKPVNKRNGRKQKVEVKTE